MVGMGRGFAGSGSGRALRRGLLGAVAGLVSVLVLSPVAVALQVPQIYWGYLSTIGVANLDGTGVNQSFIPLSVGDVDGLAVDGEHIYWANPGNDTIDVANLDGTGKNQSFITGANTPRDVAVDGKHIYWTNVGSNTIGVANLDGTGVNQNFITGADAPVGVAVDGQHIYWTNAINGTIGVANLDGTGVNQNFITGADNPVGVAVDGQHIYWANQALSTIGVANLDGTGVNESFIATGIGANEVVVDDQHIYWAEGSGAIGVANLDGTGVNQSFITGLSNTYGLAVSVPVIQVTPQPAAFASQPQATVSAPQTLTITNNGQVDLTLNALTFAGADPGDFLVTANGCLGAVAPGESCTIEISFAPQGQGARSATLQIASDDYANSPLSLPLSGTGGALPQGPQGPAGKVELITCRTVTRKLKHHHQRKVSVCTGRLVSGKVKFTTSIAHATISRAGALYGTGIAAQLGGGRQQLLLVQRLVIKPGRYTLTLRSRQGRRDLTRSTTIQIR